jgi:uncharacterized protein involved in exopolysaccharide biosynthesis
MGQSSRSLNDSQDEFDFAATKEMLVLILRAPLRRPRLAAVIFASVTLLATIAAVRARPTYEAQAAIVVQKNAMLPTFGEAAKNVPSNEIDPAVGVSEAVKGRQNLISLVQQTHLVDKTKNPLTSDEDQLQAAVKVLERKLTVTSDGATVTFVADWSDPQTAYDLVSAAVHNFLDSRTAAEVAIVSDAIDLLEEHAKSERNGIDVAMEEFLRLKETWKTPTASSAAPRVAGSSPQPGEAVGPAEQAEIARRLDEKKQQIKEMQEDRRRQLSELNAQMAGILGTLTPSHPTAIGLRRKIDAFSQEPPNLTALKNEERSLLNELAAITGPKDGAKGSAGTLGILSTRGTGAASVASKQDLEIVDPASAMALSKLQSRIRKYEDFMDQISAAKLQLDLARNAFKYRYSVFKPAEMPTRPKYPIRLLVIVGGTFLAAFLAAVVAALLDLASGHFVEPWQVKRKLSLPLLGEVIRP